MHEFIACAPPSTGPTDDELQRLAQAVLFSPGTVLLRAVRRVFGPPRDELQRLERLISLAVEALRGYLDTPEFHLLLPGRNRRAAIRQAIYEGNLEGVLDEYLTVMAGLGSAPEADAEEDALEKLTTSLDIRSSQLPLHRLGRSGTMRFRCHAALPFGLSADKVEKRTNRRLRSDFLRVAFNSPFRPFVLATTSIGQEGLDFHAYCCRIVHWDLPANPVDLEQREGRIRRYGGLSVRTALAEGHLVASWASIAAEAKERDDGLYPWWQAGSDRVCALTYATAFSRERETLEELKKSLALYRLTLGQPDQEQLIRALQRRIAEAGPSSGSLQAWLRASHISLAPR